MSRDNKIEKLLDSWCKNAGVDFPVGYNMDYSKKILSIYTNRPGYLIGKYGCIVDNFRKILHDEFDPNYDVAFVEISGGFANYKNNEDTATVNDQREISKYEITIDIATKLNSLKGYEVGYSNPRCGKMIVNLNGTNFLIDITSLDNGSLHDAMEANQNMFK